MTLSRRLLIIDDDPAIVQILSDALASPAWEIATAGDAMSAFLKARDLRPFLIVTDVQMPGFGNGTDMLRALRLEKATAAIPVIVLTGMDPARARALLPVGDARVRLLTKPPDADRVFACIRELSGVDGRADGGPTS